MLRFTAAHCTGSLDLTARRAHLSVIAPRPFEPIDYFVRAALALLAFEAGGLLFHAAGLARRGNGYAFFGYSGSGKTTVARVYPMRRSSTTISSSYCRMLHAGNIYATPFSNPTQVTPAGPQFAPLAALYRLVQDQRVFVEPIAPAAAMAAVIACSPVVSADPDRALALLALAEQSRQRGAGAASAFPSRFLVLGRRSTLTALTRLIQHYSTLFNMSRQLTLAFAAGIISE